MSDTNLPEILTPTRIRRSSRRSAAIAKETGIDLLRLARTPGKPLVSPSATREYLTTLLALEERELFWTRPVSVDHSWSNIACLPPASRGTCLI